MGIHLVALKHLNLLILGGRQCVFVCVCDGLLEIFRIPDRRIFLQGSNEHIFKYFR